MRPVIGFILVTHEKPHQTLRLVTTLNRMFDRPPIVCHHDFSKCNLSVDAFPKNLAFVRPHVETEYARFSIVEAFVGALKRMYEGPDNPDWFVLLSGADYPIKPPEQILRNLTAGSYDGHIHFELIKVNAFERDWQKKCFDRYCTKSFSFPAVTRRLRPTRRTIRLRSPLLTRAFLPFSDKLQCFAGSAWFSANRSVAEYVTQFHKANHRFNSHYRELFSPDESYFQTILANAPGFRLNNNNWRYIDWSAGGRHPKTLRSEDLPKLKASSAHFARKFDADEDTGVLDEVDRINGSGKAR